MNSSTLATLLSVHSVVSSIKKHDCLGPLNKFGQPISTWDKSCGRDVKKPSGSRETGQCDDDDGFPAYSFFGGILVGAICGVLFVELAHGNLGNFLSSFWPFGGGVSARTVSFNREEEMGKVRNLYKSWT